ncbi:Puromycin-sensitive aminopeptidase [Durusdinium trenchii]|uniref:Puromycin-sensitive aminopeptidase n=1 Tax=Durusdinium trenchii TaxID=1381693 RepID=A0ABP0P947_9DINO
MPPKSRSKSLARAETQKKALKKAATASATSDKKQVDLSFLDEVDSSVDESLVPKVFQLLGYGLAQGDRPCLLAACNAVERICEDSYGFITLVKAKGVETMLSFLRHLPQAHVAPATSEAVNAAAAAIFQRAAVWLDEVDEVDFDQLQHVLHLAFWLGSEDEDVALSALGAIERFTLYRSENGATLLQSDVLQVLHRIIGHNRAPELVSEAFTLLFRLCDAPAPAVVPLVTDESDIVRTVVESMTQAPLNMRLQLAGIRLLALWSQLDLGEDPAVSESKDLKQFIREANGFEVSREVIANLKRAGLSHAAGWMSTISCRLPQQVRGSKDSKEEYQGRSFSRTSAGSSRAKSK